MRSFASIALIASFTAIVVAQGAPPACALTCSTSTKTSCASSDFKCLCTNQDAIDAVTKCIQTTCSAADAQAALAASATLCQQLVGVTVSIPESSTATVTLSESTGKDSTVSSSATVPITSVFSSVAQSSASTVTFISSKLSSSTAISSSETTSTLSSSSSATATGTIVTTTGSNATSTDLTSSNDTSATSSSTSPASSTPTSGAITRGVPVVVGVVALAFCVFVS